MKQFLLGLGIVLFCGSTTSAADWNCKDGNRQFNIFADKLVVVNKDGDVYKYTCSKAGYCVRIDVGSEDISVTTIRIFYEKSDNGAWAKPKEFLSSSFFRLNDSEIIITPWTDNLATHFTKCEKL
mgnify:CR=1 FL=1